MKSNTLLVAVLISLVIIGTVILINFLSFSDIERLVISQIVEEQRIKTEFTANKMESHVVEVKDELVTLSKFPTMRTLDVNQCTGDMRIIHESIESKISSLLRVDADGNVIESSSQDFTNFLGLNVKNKDYFTVPKETNEPFISGAIKQGTNQQIIVSAPLFETSEYTPYPNFFGDFKGVLLSIVEVNKLYNLYIHPNIDEGKNLFLLINLNTGDTIIKSEGVGDYSEIKGLFPESKNWNSITKFGDMGDTIITSSDMILGSEKWRFVILTPLKNVSSEIESAKKRNLFSLGFVVLVIIGVFLFLIFLYKSKEVVQSKLDKTNVTLEKLGINIEAEGGKYTPSDVSLEPKKIYLVKEDEENHAHELFINSLNKGFAGLGIVRENPEEIKKRYNLTKTSFIWLSKTKVENVPCETNIDNLFTLISEFIKKSEKSVVLLDRLDYILSDNKFEDVIKKVHALKELALAHNCIIILSVNPELIEESQLKAIEAETIDLYGKHLRKRVELSDVEMEILKYINEKNITNKLVSYKDITHLLNITKPTTRAKISKLQNLGLLQVEQKGRFKSLKITSFGRKVIR